MGFKLYTEIDSKDMGTCYSFTAAIFYEFQYRRNIAEDCFLVYRYIDDLLGLNLDGRYEKFLEKSIQIL